ncbi:hypothetical protein RJ639_045177 [Escallonia herrerae]|uniref:C3H1-type domain-containing protein n=1 Tax=Escallonia herrerae TaxID=1293975 RepID=A0AA88W6H2_9ASTE|nr:hypothetical protein RJ639_045177 [Escallonia herrerae]
MVTRQSYEDMRRLKIKNNDKEDGGEMTPLSPYPDRPGEPDCIYYLRNGVCGYGSNCRFNHPSYSGQEVFVQYTGELPERVGRPDCGYFLKTGTCKYGPTCKYHHPRDRHGAGPVVVNMLGLPMRQEERSCPYYLRTGKCKFGVACKFHHPQPVSPGTVLPVPGTVYGSTGSSILPSSGLSYPGGLSALSLPRATYISAPRLQGLETYMPVVISPSQGLVPAQGWNTFVVSTANISYLTSIICLDQGSLSPVISNSVVGESGFVGQVQSLSSSVSPLPERPEQPECRYFMNTGGCKYGSDCKYHHPREKVAQLASSSLGPLGLPLRPGQAVCSFYNLYGLCKYGPTCKYDHPLVGYPYNYSLGLPSLSVLDPSLFAYQRESPAVHSSEMSPAKSLKFHDWHQKFEIPRERNQNPDARTPEDSPAQAASPLHSFQAASELPHDQSD